MPTKKASPKTAQSSESATQSTSPATTAPVPAPSEPVVYADKRDKIMAELVAKVGEVFDYGFENERGHNYWYTGSGELRGSISFDSTAMFVRIEQWGERYHLTVSEGAFKWLGTDFKIGLETVKDAATKVFAENGVPEDKLDFVSLLEWIKTDIPVSAPAPLGSAPIAHSSRWLQERLGNG